MLIETVRCSPAEGDRAARRLRDAMGDDRGLLLAVQALEQEGELVAAEAGDGVHRAQHAAEALGQLHEQPVAGAVPQRVVDLLEAVDVQEQHRPPRLPVRPAAIQRAAQAVQEQRPIGQRGERVLQCLESQRRLAALALDRVADRADQAAERRAPTGPGSPGPRPARRQRPPRRRRRPRRRSASTATRRSAPRAPRASTGRAGPAARTSPRDRPAPGPRRPRVGCG